MKALYASFDEIPSFKGASTHILANCRALSQEHDLSLLSLGESTLPWQAGFKHFPQPIVERNYLRRAQEFRSRVFQIIISDKFDFVQFRSPWEGLIPVRKKIPTIYEVNGFPSIEIVETYPNVTSRVREILEQEENECLHKSTRIICHTPKTLRYLTNNREIPANKITLIPNGYFPDAPPENLHRKHEQGQPLRLVFVGTLSKWQGIIWSLPVFKRFEGNIQLDIYGPNRKSSVKSFAKILKQLKIESTVVHKGPVLQSQLTRVLQEYDLGFAPFLKDSRNSLQGCCPVKLLDYKKAGIPILTSNLNITSPFVHMDEGLVFRANSRTDLQATLTEVHRNPSLLTDMRSNSYKSLSRFNTWSESGRALLSVTRSLRTL